MTPSNKLNRWIGELANWRDRRRKKGAFYQQFLSFSRLPGGDRLPLDWQDRYPCLDDDTGSTLFDKHYTYHTAWAARVLARSRPEVHVDIGSMLHFSTLVSAFIPFRFLDYRPAEVTLPGLEVGSCNLQALEMPDQSVQSLSCMHVVEHVGLGRYGDTLEPNGDLLAMAELQRVLAPGGSLLFVVPVGAPKIMFNAHRIYSRQQILDQFDELTLVEFTLIPMTRPEGLMVDATNQDADAETYGCGCYWFSRPER